MELNQMRIVGPTVTADPHEIIDHDARLSFAVSIWNRSQIEAIDKLA
jgi:hypothetical protein